MPLGTKLNELYKTSCNFSLCLDLVQNIKEPGIVLKPAGLHTLLHNALPDRVFHRPIIWPIDSKVELFELDLVAESQVLAEKNKSLSLEKEFTKTSNRLLRN